MAAAFGSAAASRMPRAVSSACPVAALESCERTLFNATTTRRLSQRMRFSITSACPNYASAAPALLPSCYGGASPSSASCGACMPQRRMAASAANSGDSEKNLMPEDILHLRATSMTIMQDPVCELLPDEVHKYILLRGDPLSELPAWHPRRFVTLVTNPSRPRKLAVAKLTDLIIERIDNEPLCDAFGIDTGFNMQVYFMILHAWLLHQRFVLEGAKAKKLDEELFESCWTLVRNWLWLKKIPEYRFDAELLNVQEYMLGCCIALDKALERPDILPARLQQVLWANVYSGSVKKDAAYLTRLTKYCLRQLGLMLQLEGEHFLEGNFVWADFPIPDGKPPERKQLPLWKQEFGKVMREQ